MEDDYLPIVEFVFTPMRSKIKNKINFSIWHVIANNLWRKEVSSIWWSINQNTNG